MLRCAILLTALAALVPTQSSEPPLPDTLHLSELQVIGSHNSYKQAIDPPLLQLLASFSADAQRLDYAHASLTRQLDLGLRGLELDIFHDPQGGHYANPTGLELVQRAGQQAQPYDTQHEMQQPGFKVLHVQDVDFRSSQLTLAGALDELRAWSVAHPHHLPVIVTMNLKDEKSPLPGGPAAVPWDAAAYDMLDASLREKLGRERLLTPDDVRGSAATLEQAVTTRGWPTLADCRGKWLWVLDEGDTKCAAYLRDHPGLAGRVLFTTRPPGHADSAVLVLNDPVAQQAQIRDCVARGYLVRTRADAETMEARRNDRSRLEAALSSNAQVISTDYYLPFTSEEGAYQVRFEDATYARPLPASRNRASIR